MEKITVSVKDSLVIPGREDTDSWISKGTTAKDSMGRQEQNTHRNVHLALC